MGIVDAHAVIVMKESVWGRCPRREAERPQPELHGLWWYQLMSCGGGCASMCLGMALERGCCMHATRM